MRYMQDPKLTPSVEYIKDPVVASTILENAPAFIDHLQSRIIELANEPEKAWIKPKVIYEDPIHPNDGDIRTMTCFTDRVKVIKIISTNPIREAHWSVSVGATVLLDYQENHPLMIFDAPMMSALRTSGMAVVGALFADHGFQDTCIVGTGRVGSYARDLINLAFSNANITMRDVADGTAGPDTRYDNEVVITATTSRTPFITPENCKADFLCSVGADTAFNFELSDDFLLQRKGVFVDCPDAAHVGDLSRLQLQHPINPVIAGHLFELAVGRGWNGEKPDTVVSVGSPLMDALTVEFLVDHL